MCGMAKGPPGSPGVVGRSSRKSGSGWQIIRDAREWSGGNSGCQGVVRWHSRMSGSGREDLTNVRK